MNALVYVLAALIVSSVLANIFEYEVTDFEGNTVSLSKYANAKAILIGEFTCVFSEVVSNP